MTSPLQALFLAVVLCGSGYLLFARRAFDLPALGFFSGVFYFAPGLTGLVGYPIEFIVIPVPIETEAYIVMVFVLAALFATAILNDLATPRFAANLSSTLTARTASWVALTLASSGAVMTLLNTGSHIFAGDKFYLLNELSRWHLLWTSCATLSAVFAFVSRRWVAFAMSLALLIFNVYIGFRVDLVIAIVALAICWLTTRPAERLVIHWRAISVIVVVGTAMLVLKQVLVAVQLFNADLLIAQLRNPAALETLLLHSEPFVVQGTLNEVVRQQYWVGPEHLVEVLYLLVPFANELGATAGGFNPLFQPSLFSTVTGYGLANNLWAQMLASGGWPVLGAFTGVYCAVLLIGDRLLRRVSPSTFVLLTVVFAYWAFYAHRNDLIYQLTLTRRVLLAGLLVLLLAVILQAIYVGWSHFQSLKSVRRFRA